MKTCPVCGFENVEDAKFCENCIIPLTADAEAFRSQVLAQRRAITINFADCHHDEGRAAGQKFCDNCAAPLK